VANFDIFRNNAKSIPTSDGQIIRVNMEEIEIGGRKSHLPASRVAGDMALSHVPNAGTNIGTGMK
jgi:hypothetical protein